MAETQDADISKSDFRWGVPVLDDGDTRIHNYILKHYSSVPWIDENGKSGAGLSNTEMMFIIHLASFKWNTPQSKSMPSLSTTLRERMGYKSNQGIFNILKGLEQKNLVTVERESGKRSIYNFQPFAQACFDLENLTRQQNLTGQENLTALDETRQENLTSTRQQNLTGTKEIETEKIETEKAACAATSPNAAPAKENPKDYLQHAAEIVAQRQVRGDQTAIADASAPGDEFQRLVALFSRKGLGRAPPNGKKATSWKRAFRELVKSVGEEYDLERPCTRVREALEELTRDEDHAWSWKKSWRSPFSDSFKETLSNQVGQALVKAAQPGVGGPSRPVTVPAWATNGGGEP